VWQRLLHSAGDLVDGIEVLAALQVLLEALGAAELVAAQLPELSPRLMAPRFTYVGPMDRRSS